MALVLKMDIKGGKASQWKQNCITSVSIAYLYMHHFFTSTCVHTQRRKPHQASQEERKDESSKLIAHQHHIHSASFLSLSLLRWECNLVHIKLHSTFLHETTISTADRCVCCVMVKNAVDTESFFFFASFIFIYLAWPNLHNTFPHFFPTSFLSPYRSLPSLAQNVMGNDPKYFCSPTKKYLLTVTLTCVYSWWSSRNLRFFVVSDMSI